MRGHAHYKQAEYLLADARRQEMDMVPATLAEAQVHATLALVAVIAETGIDRLHAYPQSPWGKAVLS